MRISRIQSWLFWKDRYTEKPEAFLGYRFPDPLDKWLEATGNTDCPFCSTYKWFPVEWKHWHEDVYCLCSLLEWIQEKSNVKREFETTVEPASLDTLKPVNNINNTPPGAAGDLRDLKEYVYGWMDNPVSWMTISGEPGSGKCLAPGTKILMFDGSVKVVEDIKENDLIMGPDSKPKKVLSLAHGYDEMYKVIPTKGIPFIANGPHILSLEIDRHGKKDSELISINDFINKDPTFKIRAKAQRTSIDFIEKEIPIDPYFLGVWLGDGDSVRPCISTMDKEIVDCITNLAHEFDLNVNEYNSRPCPIYLLAGIRGKKNPILEILRNLDLIKNKHIPEIYKINSKEIRLQILAGLLDTDGSLHKNCFDFISKYKTLSDDVVFLARSLGFAAYVRTVKNECCNTHVWNLYYRVSISGNTHEIPTRIERKKASFRKQCKNVLRTGIKIESVGYGEYYGFELDGDGLFVLGDFTITHNTHILRAIRTRFNGMSMFIDAASFQQHLFSARTEPTGVRDLIQELSIVPILLFDDMGLEHDNAWTTNVLAAVINNRYKLWKEFPTVVTTNLNIDGLVGSSNIAMKRIADRLVDGESSRVFVLRQKNFRETKQPSLVKAVR